MRQKKRKELRRLQNRLAELGEVAFAQPRRARTSSTAWCDAFLALEKAGWKGGAGTALACAARDRGLLPRGRRAARWAAGRLQFLRLDLDGRPIAMLVNFLTPPGAFSFKTAFDEDYARFSPGVLIQLENLDILDRGDIAWMDSCAAEDHPMIDSLWRERRAIVRVTVPLSRRPPRARLRRLPRARDRLGAPPPAPQGMIAMTASLSTPRRCDAFAAAYPEQPALLGHRLVDHPLLKLEALAELARRIRPVDVEYNRGDVPVGIDPADTPANGLSVAGDDPADRAMRLVDGAQVRRAGSGSTATCSHEALADARAGWSARSPARC